MKRYKVTDGRINKAQAAGDMQALQKLSETCHKPRTATQYVKGISALEDVQKAQRAAYEERRR